MTGPVTASSPVGTCPVCDRPAREETRPFCSARCRTVDLGRWLGGGYAIPAEPVADEDEEA